MGFLSALIVGPCVAPPLMAALIVIGSSGGAVLGGAALVALSVGMGVPLILFGVSAGKFVPRAGAWMNAVKAVFGVGLLALAIWMLERILPGPVVMLLWGALAIGCGVYLGALDRIESGASGWRRLWKSLGVLLLLLGALEIIGAAAGGDYWLRPLAGLNARSAGAAAGGAPAAGEPARSSRRSPASSRCRISSTPSPRRGRAAVAPCSIYTRTGVSNASAWNTTPFPIPPCRPCWPGCSRCRRTLRPTTPPTRR
jgi:hypothetical protein